MAEYTVPTLTQGRLTHAGHDAVLAVQPGTAYNVVSPDFGADPTGQADSTAAIQKAIDRAAAAGGGSVEIPAGTYKVTDPYIQLRGRVVVYGHGMGTCIVATGDVPAGELTGVFHTGTYAARLQDAACTRFGVRDLFIKCRTADFQHTDPIENVAGIIYNTDLGGSPGDPDAVPVLENIEIWDMEIGAAILGRDDQGMKCRNLRIRQARRQGLLVGKPGNHPEVVAKAPGGPGGADNDFSAVDVSGANRAGSEYAGIEIYTSQTKFSQSKSWYNRRTCTWQELYGLPAPEKSGDGTLSAAYVAPGAEITAGASRTRTMQHAGAGWYIKGTKNHFEGCTAQENGGHGWMCQWGKNQYVMCLGESSSWHEALQAAPADRAEFAPARTLEAADFYMCADAQDSIFIGCRAESARKNSGGARWGYYIETYAKNLHVVNSAAQNHPIAADGTTQSLCLGKNLRENVRVEVNGELYSTLPRDKEIVHDAQLHTREAKRDYRSHLRAVLVPTYIYPDYFKPVSEQQYLRLALAADVMPFIIINPNSGPGDGPGSAQHTDFTNQLKKNRGEFGQKIFGYIRTGASLGKPRPVEELYAEVEEYLKWYDVDGIFWDEAYNGWGDQKGKEVYHQNIAAWMNEHYPWLPTVVNPGANTTADMVGTGWYMMTFEQEADKYLTDKYLIQEHYKGVPRQMFWHCIHDVASFDQAVKVLRLADTLNVGNLYLTDDTIWETVNGQRSRTANPYDRLPSEWLWKLQIAWARDRLDEYLSYIQMMENQLAVLQASAAPAEKITPLQTQIRALKGE